MARGAPAPEPGAPAPSRGSGAIRAVLAGLAIAAIPMLVYRGFTVDDALIPARYAHHIARGDGYVFNTGGPRTDGVTPLGFPYLLAPFAKPGPLAALAFSRALGALSWLVGSALLAFTVLKIGGSRWRFAALALVVFSAPLAAWSQAGLETGLVTALVAVALFLRSCGRTWAGTVVLGLTAAMRPELLPMVVVLAFPRGLQGERDSQGERDREGDRVRDRDRDRDRDRGRDPAPAFEADPEWTRPRLPPITAAHFARAFLAALPFAIVACIRLVVFGKAAPLSIYAKPPDAEFGAVYAGACFLLTGPVAVIAPFTWWKLEAWAKWLVAAIAVHFATVIVVGGDWMPLSRLVVPVLPVVVLAAAHVASRAEAAFTIGRFILALTAEGVTFFRQREASARVLEERLALVREVAPYLQGRRAIASVDIGWVGVAADTTVIDLAGVTDPLVAFLPGAHATKEIPDAMIDTRNVDTLVFQLHAGAELVDPWMYSKFDKGVERYVALGPGIGESFGVVYVSTGRVRYVVLHRLEAKLASAGSLAPFDSVGAGVDGAHRAR